MWQLIALLAYFLLSITGVIDKILVSGAIKSPKALVFFISILSLALFLIAPLVGLVWVGFNQFIIAVVAGAIFSLALLSYFKAAKDQEISRVIPGIAGFAPIFTLIFSVNFLGDTFSWIQLLAFVFLVVGGVLITFERNAMQTENMRHLFGVVLAALLFSISFILAKAVYNMQPFWSGFMWMRLGGGIFVLLFLLKREWRKEIFSQARQSPVSGKTLFFSGQAVSSIAFILQNFAFSLGPVALVNALESTRHFFILLLTVILSKFYPNILREVVGKGAIIYKVFAIGLIMTGLFLVFN
ncbi:DMT family transporter [Candidatus Parcubacteria bacterium]|nr:MAG: DMT family transporter [Candidatus Parcubacteria bacterium]